MLKIEQSDHEDTFRRISAPELWMNKILEQKNALCIKTQVL